EFRRVLFRSHLLILLRPVLGLLPGGERARREPASGHEDPVGDLFPRIARGSLRLRRAGVAGCRAHDPILRRCPELREGVDLPRRPARVSRAGPGVFSYNLSALLGRRSYSVIPPAMATTSGSNPSRPHHVVLSALESRQR